MRNLIHRSLWGACLCGLVLLFSACQTAPEGLYNITDFGAVGDSATVNTQAINEAIREAHQAGGGTVVVPAPGRFVSGTVHLLSNVTLRVEAGAMLLGSSNLADYDSLSWGHNEDRQPYHFIQAKGQKNITIEGRGTIDGRGYTFWEHNRETPPRWIKKPARRPSPMVEIQDCQDVVIKDVFLTNSAGWTLHLYDTDVARVTGIRLVNNLYGPNTDGIDITGCRDVVVSDSYVKTCDDAVCIKTTEDSRECSDISVTNCTVQTTCVAFKFGESYKDIRNVTFSNLVVHESSRAIGVYGNWGGTIEDVVFSNIVCNTNAPLVLNRPIQIGIWPLLNMKTKEKLYESGRIRNVLISNFVSTSQGRILISAPDSLMLENITLKDIRVRYPYIEDPSQIGKEATSNQINGVPADGRTASAAIVALNVKNLVVEGFGVDWPGATFPKAWMHPERIENGSDRVHKGVYDKTIPGPFALLYGRNLQGGYLDKFMGQNAVPGQEAVTLLNSSIEPRFKGGKR